MCVSHFNWTTSIIYEIITQVTLHRNDKFSTNNPQAEYWAGVLFSWKDRNFSSVRSCGLRASSSSNVCTSNFDVSVSLAAVWQVDQMRINRMKLTIKYTKPPCWPSSNSNKVKKSTIMVLTNNQHVKAKTEILQVSLIRETIKFSSLKILRKERNCDPLKLLKYSGETRKVNTFSCLTNVLRAWNMLSYSTQLFVLSWLMQLHRCLLLCLYLSFVTRTNLP